MRTKGIVWIVVLASISAVLPGCAMGVQATVDRAPPPPSPDQLVGTWFSVSPWEGHRLDLFDDGTATLAFAHVSETGVIRRYATQHWNLVGRELSAAFVPVDSDRDTVYLRALASSEALWNVSISLSDSVVPVPGGLGFARESRVKQLLNLLAPSS